MRGTHQDGLDPTRRMILEALAPGERSVGELVEHVQTVHSISQPAVSQHLKVLRGAGIVTVRAEGTRRLYAIDPSGIEVVVTWLHRLADPIDQFAQPLDALATEVARGQRTRRSGTTGSSATADAATA